MTSFGAALLAPSRPSESRRPNGSRPSSLPLLAWPQTRQAMLIETRRQELSRLIAKLKPRSHARIIAEAELRAATHRALQAETQAETVDPT